MLSLVPTIASYLSDAITTAYAGVRSVDLPAQAAYTVSNSLSSYRDRVNRELDVPDVAPQPGKPVLTGRTASERLMLLALRIFCIGLTWGYQLSSVHPAIWRRLVRRYRPWMSRLARTHARATCRLAALSVPAYRDFLRGRKGFPETSKKSYVMAYDETSRCRNGRLDLVGTMVDESSGSSGRPFNWVRGRRELAAVYRNAAGYTGLIFHAQKPFVINAFSMGAWATGTNTGIAMLKVAMVKNTGPDLDKIVDTLRHFGPGFDYLITAYPPFLKHLRDRLDSEGFDWQAYKIHGVVGGEALTEALRDYLTERFTSVRSCFGASDLTIGMGVETGFTVWLRKELLADPALRAELIGADEQRLPMIFQYNPLDTYLEVNDSSELLCTVTSTHTLQPKLRYNIGDEAALLSYDDVVRALKRDPVRWQAALEATGTERMSLPLLLLYGRADSTISYMGANIYPQDVEYGLYEENPLAESISRFCLSLVETTDHESRPVVNIELRGPISDAEREELAATCRAGVLRHLAKVSRDFAQSLAEDPTAADVRVRIFDPGIGPFAATDQKLKNTYLVKETDDRS
jgi:phenylacetate-CoA ligase